MVICFRTLNFDILQNVIRNNLTKTVIVVVTESKVLNLCLYPSLMAINTEIFIYKVGVKHFSCVRKSSYGSVALL